MTNTQHRKILSTIFFVLGTLSVFGWIVLNGWKTGDWMSLVYAILYVITGWKIHNNMPNARIFGIVACLISIPSFPIGTAIGIYGLWYFLFESKKDF